MKPERWKQMDQLLEAALEREPKRRAEFLNQACGGDEELPEQEEQSQTQGGSTSRQERQ